MIKRWQMPLVALVTVVPLLATAPAHADCVDINADPAERLTAIAHIDDERAVQLIAGRPWPSVRSLTGINGIGRGRIREHDDASDAADRIAELVDERRKKSTGICR